MNSPVPTLSLQNIVSAFFSIGKNESTRPVRCIPVISDVFYAIPVTFDTRLRAVIKIVVTHDRILQVWRWGRCLIAAGCHENLSNWYSNLIQTASMSTDATDCCPRIPSVLFYPLTSTEPTTQVWYGCPKSVKFSRNKFFILTRYLKQLILKSRSGVSNQNWIGNTKNWLPKRWSRILWFFIQWNVPIDVIIITKQNQIKVLKE